MKKYAVEIMDRKGNIEIWAIAFENEVDDAVKSAKEAYPDFIVTAKKFFNDYAND